MHCSRRAGSLSNRLVRARLHPQKGGRFKAKLSQPTNRTMASGWSAALSATVGAGRETPGCPCSRLRMALCAEAYSDSMRLDSSDQKGTGCNAKYPKSWIVNIAAQMISIRINARSFSKCLLLFFLRLLPREHRAEPPTWLRSVPFAWIQTLEHQF